VRATGTTDYYREMTSTFFAMMLANGLGAKQCPAIVPLSESLGPPGPQTCHSRSSRISSSDQTPTLSCPTFAVFGFPDELILSVLSYLSPDPGLTGQYSRSRFQYNMGANAAPVEHDMQGDAIPVAALDHGAFSSDWKGGENLVRRHKAIVGALRADPGLTTSVKYFCPLICPWVWADLRPLKVPDDIPSIDQIHNPIARRMPGVPSKSPRARDTSSGHAHYRPARESP
jgi:hypothetical protein